MQGRFAPRLASAVEHEVALHGELVAVLRNQPLGCESQEDVVQSIRFAASERRSLLARLPGADSHWTLTRTISALPDEEAERLREIRREFGSVLQALAVELRKRAEKVRPQQALAA